VLLDALPTDDRHQQITTYLGSVFGLLNSLPEPANQRRAGVE
jgi:hypothetical protein